MSFTIPISTQKATHRDLVAEDLRLQMLRAFDEGDVRKAARLGTHLDSVLEDDEFDELVA